MQQRVDEEQEEERYRPDVCILGGNKEEMEHACREELRARLWRQLSRRCNGERVAKLEAGSQQPRQFRKDMKDIPATLDVNITTAL